MRTGRCRGAPPRLPFFFVVGAFGTRVSAAVACKPSVVHVKHRWRYEGKFSYLMLIAGAGLPRLELLTSATGRGTLVFPNESVNKIQMRIRRKKQSIASLCFRGEIWSSNNINCAGRTFFNKRTPLLFRWLYLVPEYHP